MIPTKICEFCNTESMYVPLSTGMNEYSKTLRVHYCTDCKAEYVYWSSDGDLAIVHLYTSISDKMYRWSIAPHVKGGRLWYVGEPGIPGQKANKNLVLLKNLDLNGITPSNIEDKVRIYLPFL